jgi:hypothetical protein
MISPYEKNRLYGEIENAASKATLVREPGAGSREPGAGAGLLQGIERRSKFVDQQR